MHKIVLKPCIDTFTSLSLASILSIFHYKKTITDYEYVSLAELCIDDHAQLPDIIKNIQRTVQIRSVKNKVAYFENVTQLSHKTQRKIMGNEPTTGTSAISAT